MIRITQTDEASFIIELDELLRTTLSEITGNKTPENFLRHVVSEAILTSLYYADQIDVIDDDLPF